MSYKITARIYQTNTNAYFHLVEQTVWNYANGGTWTEANGEKTLTIGGSGTSGTLRFESDTGERFIVAIGVHNYKRWVDIVTGLAPDQTGVVINAEYYNNVRSFAREKQLSTYTVTSKAGRKFTATYTVAEGNDLKLNIIIG